MLQNSIGWLSAHVVNLGAFSVFQFLSVRNRESREREFEQYHLLIQRLTSPDDRGNVYPHRQVATVFELRHFPRYHECTKRILENLKQTWGPQKYPSLIDEIDLTLSYIKEKL